VQTGVAQVVDAEVVQCPWKNYFASCKCIWAKVVVIFGAYIWTFLNTVIFNEFIIL
jgi:hypothetical protein